MILGAPASVQFTRNFLRHMIQATQGGFLRGNIVIDGYMATQCFKHDSYLLDCLTRGILEFGLNFLNFRAVKSDVVEALSAVVTSSEVCVDRPLVSRLNDLVA